MTHSTRLFKAACLCFALVTCSSIDAQTISEKKALLAGGGADLDQNAQTALNQTNLDLTTMREQLSLLHEEAFALYEENAPEEEFQKLLIDINALRLKIAEVQEEWRQIAVEEGGQEKYALWQQPETTIEQLVIDYGSQDYVYLIPEEVTSKVVSVNSDLPIPRASWSMMLETILSQNGIGIRQLNPFLRELYPLADGNASVQVITNRRIDLSVFPKDAQIAFILTPDPEDVRRTWFFLDKFTNPNNTIMQLVGRDILIISKVRNIQELLKLYDFVVANRTEKEHRLVPLSKVNAEEMAKILGAVFDQVADVTKVSLEGGDENTPQDQPIAPPKLDSNGLQIVLLESISQALFLVGTKEEVNRAERLVRDVESRIRGAREKTIYWYTVKHSNADELAQILQYIYTLMIQSRVGFSEGEEPGDVTNQDVQVTANLSTPGTDTLSAQEIFSSPQYLQGSVGVETSGVRLSSNQDIDVPSSQQFGNFIADLKTGSIVMVVEEDILPKLKELLTRLDVPKKMVKIDVLLFEKRVNDTTDYGLDLLRIGGCADNKKLTCVSFNNTQANGGTDPVSGIFSFFLSRTRGGGVPAYDLAFQFLLQQQDIQINANPSVMTINQTPAHIKVLEEISLDTGTFTVAQGGVQQEKTSFTRAQYGIEMEITPTIHMRENNDPTWDPDIIDYITLDTNVIFDTFEINPQNAQQPNVTRRNITNEVLVPDGQTVILGGLRRKTTTDQKNSIPFFGELPCLGKLFSETSMKDISQEMFIFITPKIIDDPCQDLERIKYEELNKRPGDIPDFLCCLNDARDAERRRALRQSMLILLGRPRECCDPTLVPCIDGPWHDLGEYDGRY